MYYLELQNFIQSHTDWKERLQEKPYKLTIKEDEKYVIFNYSQIESDFSLEIVRESRGVILRRDDFRVVCMGFKKFFNYAESYAAKINWDTARIQEKIDGSIIKVWFDDGFWHVSTNGTIDAANAELPNIKGGPKNFYDLWLNGFASSSGRPIKSNWNIDYTYMFELVSPWNRIVVPYKKTAIFHIGTRDNVTGKEIDTDIGIQKPHSFRFDTFDDLLKMAESLPFDEEGYVVVDKNWNRVKVKSPAYVAAHHLKNNGVLTDKRFIDLIRTGESEEFLNYYPEYEGTLVKIRKGIEIFSERLYADWNEATKKIEEMDMSGSGFKENRKEFAAWATKTTMPALMFMLYDGRVDSVDSFINSISSEKLAQLI